MGVWKGRLGAGCWLGVGWDYEGQRFRIHWKE